MKILMLIAAIVAVTLASPVEDNIVHYDGYQVIRTFPNTPEQYQALHAIEEAGHYDFWSDVSVGRTTDIMVSPAQMEVFQQLLATHKIQNEIFIPDVEKIISEQREASARRVKSARFDWDDYSSIDEIQAFVKQLASDFPSLASVQNIGKSYEGRDMLLVKISTGGSGKAAVFIDGNIHAREWISPAVVTYVINELTTNAHLHLDVLSVYDFYIVPNVNPDGYAYTQTQRLWRKTRSENGSPSGCLGTDGNRNYAYNWGEPGASAEPCSDTYRGPSVFSEPENVAIQNFILNTNVRWTFFLTVHSYGQYCLLPYGDGTRPDDYSELLAKGNVFAAALRAVSGTVYSVGNSRDLLYTTSGTSQDWAKGTANFKYSYTLELRDTGAYGFLLPPSQIRATAIETWAGIKAMLKD